VDDAKKKVAEATVTDVDRPYKNLAHRVFAAVLVVLGGKYGATAVVLAVTWFGLELPVVRDWMHAHAHHQLLATWLLGSVLVAMCLLLVYVQSRYWGKSTPMWVFWALQVLMVLCAAASRFNSASSDRYAHSWLGVAMDTLTVYIIARSCWG
jgi:hypothetical protein